MADEPQLHDLTKLLLKRLESNPEEFSRIKLSDREWFETIEVVREHGTNLDRDTLNTALDKFHMDDTLEGALKGLLNGDGDGDGAALRSMKHPTGPGPGRPSRLAAWTGGMNVNNGGFGVNSRQNQQQLSQLTYEEMLAQVRAQMPPLGVPTTTALTSFGQIKKRLGL
jgi:hypothetical protein